MTSRFKLFARGLASNGVNAVSKDLHAALRRATGRGDAMQSPEQVAAHFSGCFDDYLTRLAPARADALALLRNAVVLEYGPGDVPGVALLMVAHGADRAACVDRFPLLRLSAVNRAAMRLLASGLGAEERARFLACFDGEDARGGLRPSRLAWEVTADGLSGLRGEADLVISRAVLEHVNRLERTFSDMAAALKPGGRMIHCVDLRNHEFEWGHPLDFLTVPDWAWRLLSSHNGSMPNRLRVSEHRRILAALPFDDVRLEPTVTIGPDVADAVRPRLARRFRGASVEDLTLLGFWLTARRR